MKRFLVILIIVLVWFGVSNLWHSVRYRQPAAVSLASPIKDELPPYVRLQDFIILAAESVTAELHHAPKLYTPVRYGSQPHAKPLKVLLEVRDPVLIAAVEGLQKKDDLEEELKVMKLFREKTELVGMTHSWDMGTNVRKDLRQAFPDLDENFVLLQEGEAPSAVMGFVNLAAAAGLLWLMLRKSRPKSPPPSPAEPPLV